MNKSEVLNIAKAQLALDYNCLVSDLEKPGVTITENKCLDGRRPYDANGWFLKILVFGNSAIVSCDPKIRPWVEENLGPLKADWLFDYDMLRGIDQALNNFGYEIERTPHFYLPDPNAPKVSPVMPIEWFEEAMIVQFEDDRRFGEAFVFDDNYPDVLGVAAYEGDSIIGMAGASADSHTMYQIGIDVIEAGRGKGIGANLTALLKQELLARGKVPFYGTGLSHIHSKNVAINAGFFPAWVELYTKPVK